MKSDYFEQVFWVCSQIPFGKVTTYGLIADYLALGSARMVGWALFQGKSSDPIPAHRVVNSKGELSGRNHFPSPTYMQEMLENEGLHIFNHKIVHFERHLWNPSLHLQNF